LGSNELRRLGFRLAIHRRVVPGRHIEPLAELCRRRLGKCAHRANYNESVRPKIYDRMVSERRQIAERFLSEGNGEAARIRGNRVRDLNKIQSEAYRQVEEIRGLADAKATEIYARAYNQSPKAVEFYEFTRTMQAYKSIIAENTTLVLSTGSDLFKFLKGMAPDGEVVSAKRSVDNR
jgi:membrane protease subunit HflC